MANGWEIVIEFHPVSAGAHHNDILGENDYDR